MPVMRRAVHDDRDPHFLVAVLARVDVEEQVHERPDEPRPGAAIDDEAGAARSSPRARGR